MLRRTEDAPVEYVMVTNGVTTIVSKWDGGQPLLRLSFTDFVNGKAKYQQLRELLDPSAFTDEGTDDTATATINIRRRSVNEINSDFAWCHRLIHRRESLGYSAAFMELVKLIFLKLLSDREVHRLHAVAAAPPETGIDIPVSDVRFSVPWIEARERDTPNPMNTIQFTELLRRLEDEIAQGHKKRIFNAGDRLLLSNETIKEIGRRIQGADLYAIDSDLNGRLFETFLNATLRGKDLGQYFTPRSVVKLGVRLAGIEVDANHQDVVLDACCGTAGS